MNPQEQLTEIRRLIGCQEVYEEAWTRLLCVEIYGRNIENWTWDRWLKKVRASADPAGLNGLSTATHCLLVELAKLLAGNGKTRRRQAPLSRLVESARQTIKGGAPFELKDINSYEYLRMLIEQRAKKRYTDSYHRRNGLKKTQPWYIKAEGAEIMSKYPNFSHDQQAS